MSIAAAELADRLEIMDLQYKYGTPKQISTWGRYLDYLSRQNGRWGIDRRVTIRDLDEVADFTIGSDDRLWRRDSSDPSYAAFASLKSR